MFGQAVSGLSTPSAVFLVCRILAISARFKLGAFPVPMLANMTKVAISAVAQRRQGAVTMA